MAKSLQRRRAGFTWIELLIVIAIIAVVFGFGAVVVGRLREQSGRAQCRENLQRLGGAIHQHASVHNHRLPFILDYRVEHGVGWTPFFFCLYPHIDEDAQCQRAQGSGAAWRKGNDKTPVPVLLCPSDPTANFGFSLNGWAGTSYAPNTLMFANSWFTHQIAGVRIACPKYKLSNIPDGTSQTSALVERFASFPFFEWSNAALAPMDPFNWGWNSNGSAYGAWGLSVPQIRPPVDGWAGNAPPANPFYPNTGHAACQVLMMDASVRSFDGRVDEKTWELLIVPDDGMWNQGDW